MAEFDAELDETEVKLQPQIYCEQCMIPMRPVATGTFACTQCSFQYTEK